MTDNRTLNPINKKDNIRILRGYLGLTQREFISQFLSDKDGEPMISIATLSNLEARGGARINDVVLAVSKSLAVDAMIFSMDPDEFSEKIGVLLPSTEDTEQILRSGQKKGNIHDLIYRLTMYFADQIFDKKLKKGDKIESDRVLAAKMKVGRSAIREALKVLDVLGMIDVRPGQGSYINNNEANFFIIPLSWSLFLNGNQVDSLITVRNVLEVKAAELAAKCTDNVSIAKFHDVFSRVHNAYMEKNYKDFLDGDLDFHLCVAECSKNQVIFSMIQTIRNLMKHVSESGMVDEEQLKEIYEEHQKIYGLIFAQDAQGAAKAMHEHLENSMRRYNYR